MDKIHSFYFLLRVRLSEPKLIKKLVLSRSKHPTWTLKDSKTNSECSRIDVSEIEPRNAPNGETNRCKIYKVRYHTIHEDSIRFFKPKILSIGPYHHGSSSLSGMETWKLDCRSYFLADYVSESYYDKQEIKELVNKAKSFYKENIAMEPNKFADMLLLDGCFSLAALTEIKGETVENVPSETATSGGQGTTLSDTTGHTGGGRWQDDRHQDEAIYREDRVHDLLLLDNQIPFFVIEEIHRLAAGERETTESLKEKIAKYVEGVLHNYPKAVDIPKICSEDFHHVLHLCHMFFRPSPNTVKRNGNQAVTNQAMWHRAMRYREAGVEFRAKEYSSTPHSLLDVTFSNGTMEIPRLIIDGKTESIFSNLILFEQGCPHVEKCINAYVVFMSQLLNDAEDVKLLARKEIIQILNHEEEVLNIFRRLNGLAVVDRCGEKYYLTSTFQSVEAHYRCRFNWWMAWLKHNHLTNPCVATVALVGLLALLCTIIQQLLSILSHFKLVH